jgi:hypothetical protein
MTYVPIVPHSPSSPPSPRTRDLASLLTKVLEEYRKTHPATTDAEIRAAVRLAQLTSRSGNPAVPLLVSLCLGLLVAGVLGALFFFRSAGGAEFGPEMPMVVMALVVFLAIVAILVKVRSS